MISVSFAKEGLDLIRILFFIFYFVDVSLGYGTSLDTLREFHSVRRVCGGGDQWRDSETCVVQETVSLFSYRRSHSCQRESHGEPLHTDAQLDCDR